MTLKQTVMSESRNWSENSTRGYVWSGHHGWTRNCGCVWTYNWNDDQIVSLNWDWLRIGTRNYQTMVS